MIQLPSKTTRWTMSGRRRGEANIRRRRVLQVFALAWAVVGAAIALPVVSSVDSDARLLVGAASVLGPLAAVAAAVLIGRQFERWAGVLFLASVITPTYFAWAVNVPALLAGLVLVTAPAVLVRDHGKATAA